MLGQSHTEHMNLFRCLFKGRDDVFAVRWEQGRQAFLEISPENFSRILHDYSANKKGFLLWKSALEEAI